MEMKQVYEALEKVENGANLIAAIKAKSTLPTTRLRSTARQESRARQS